MSIENFVDSVSDSIARSTHNHLWDSYNSISNNNKRQNNASFVIDQENLSNYSDQIDNVVDTIVASEKIAGKPETEAMLLNGLHNNRVIQLTNHFDLDLLTGKLISTRTTSHSSISLTTAQFRFITEIAMSPGLVRPIPLDPIKRRTDDTQSYRIGKQTNGTFPLYADYGLRFIANPTTITFESYISRKVFWRTFATLIGKAFSIGKELSTVTFNPLMRKANILGEDSKEIEIRNHEINLIFMYAALGILGLSDFDPDTSFVASEVLPVQVTTNPVLINQKSNELGLPFTIATTALKTHNRVVLMPKGRSLNPVVETVIDHTVKQRAQRT